MEGLGKEREQAEGVGDLLGRKVIRPKPDKNAVMQLIAVTQV